MTFKEFQDFLVDFLQINLLLIHNEIIKVKFKNPSSI